MVLTFFEGQQPLEEIVDTKGDTRWVTLFARMRNMFTSNKDKTRGVVNGAFQVLRDFTKVIDRVFIRDHWSRLDTGHRHQDV